MIEGNTIRYENDVQENVRALLVQSVDVRDIARKYEGSVEICGNATDVQ